VVPQRLGIELMFEVHPGRPRIRRPALAVR
jgi:hypothetical protein